MPHGRSRFMGAVVLLALLMPLVPASAQGPAKQPAATALAIVEVGGDFVIRSVVRAAPPEGVRLGHSIRLDRALLAPFAAPVTQGNEGGSLETR